MSDEMFSLSAAEAQCLAALLDELIPASSDGTRPAAGALGLAGEVAAMRVDEASRADLRAGLQRLGEAASGEGAQFAALSREQRLRAIAQLNEALPAFLNGLLQDTYVAYYQHERVARAVGLEAWPPHPQGFPLETGDLSLLDPVRARGSIFREV